MQKLLHVGTHGSDDPTRATMPILGAAGALDKGYEPAVFLIGEAVSLMKGDVVDAGRDIVSANQLRSLGRASGAALLMYRRGSAQTHD